MRVLVSECERYFERPLCGMTHVHTQDCWHEDLQNALEDLQTALSDVRALTNRADDWKREADKLNKELSALKARPVTVTGIRGEPSWVWVDEMLSYSVDGRELAEARLAEAKKVDRAERQLSELVRKTYHHEQDVRVRQVVRSDGIISYQTSDGKQFTTADAAHRHAALLQKP